MKEVVFKEKSAIYAILPLLAIAATEIWLIHQYLNRASDAERIAIIERNVAEQASHLNRLIHLQAKDSNPGYEAREEESQALRGSRTSEPAVKTSLKIR